jgi:hypothetical protein
VREFVLDGLFVSIGTFIPTVAFPLCKEGTNVRAIAFVIWVGPCKLFQHFFPGRGRPLRSEIKAAFVARKLSYISERRFKDMLRNHAHLALHILSVVLPIYVTGRGIVFHPKRRVSNLRRKAVLEV